MPFGIRPFRDRRGRPEGRLPGGASPMPFGIRPFRDVRRGGRDGADETGRRAGGLQCLSAFVRFGTRESISEAALGGAGLQCLSAFVRFGTAQGGVALMRLPREGGPLSPMPFGIRPFRDSAEADEAGRRAGASPMPFGIRPFRDLSQFCGGLHRVTVSNAFRHSSVSGPG